MSYADTEARNFLLKVSVVIADVRYAIISYILVSNSSATYSDRRSHSSLHGNSEIGHDVCSYFYPRDAMRKRGLCCRRMSVCPSVTCRYCV